MYALRTGALDGDPRHRRWLTIADPPDKIQKVAGPTRGASGPRWRADPQERPLVRLPNADRSVVDIRKLRDYCLNAEHPRGRHKARVFESALGFTRVNGWELRELLLSAARTDEATRAELDLHGQRYIVDLSIRGLTRTVVIRSAWIVQTGEDFPRLTSCFVL